VKTQLFTNPVLNFAVVVKFKYDVWGGNLGPEQGG